MSNWALTNSGIGLYIPVTMGDGLPPDYIELPGSSWVEPKVRYVPERLCEAEPYDNLAESEGTGDAWLQCSECDGLLAVLTDGDMVPSYCPWCGAKVTNAEKWRDQ